MKSSLRCCFYLLCCLPLFTQAQVNLTTIGSAYTQNFDTPVMVNTSFSFTTIGTTAPGWFAQNNLGTEYTAHIADNGSQTSTFLYSYGSALNNDRGLGLFKVNSSNQYAGVLLRNNTGSAITALEISYEGEQWRRGSSTSRWDFSYQQSATSITSLNTGTFTGYAALDYTAPNNGSQIAIDGNAAGNHSTVSDTLGITIPAGEFVLLRWTLSNTNCCVASQQHGLAIDDVSIRPLAVATVEFAAAFGSQTESVVTPFNIQLAASNPGASPATVDVTLTGGTATNGTDISSFTTPMTVNIPAGFSGTINVPITHIDDCDTEGNETLLFGLSNGTGGIQIGGQNTFSYTIVDDPTDQAGQGTATVENVTTGASTVNSDVFMPGTAGQDVEIDLTGVASATFTQIEIDIPTGWTGLTAGNVSLSGTGLAAASSSVSGNTITISGAALTNTATGTVSISNLTSRALSSNTDVGRDTFAVRTGTLGCTPGALININKPVAYLLVPIANVRRAILSGSVNCSGFPFFMVAFSGKANVRKGILENSQTRLNIAMQDDTTDYSGIMVRSTSNPWQGTPVAEGDSLIVKGRVSIFQCFIQVSLQNGTPASYIWNLGAQTPYQPLVRTLAQLFANKDAYEGMLVRINNVYKNPNNTSNQTKCFPLSTCGGTGCGPSFFGGGSGCNTLVTDYTSTASDIQMYMHPPSCIANSISEPCWPIDIVGIWQDYGGSASCNTYAANCSFINQNIEVFMRSTADVIQPAHDTVRWTGRGNGTSWEDGSNWCSGTPPLPFQHVVIEQSGCAWNNITVNLPDTAVTIQSLTLYPHGGFTVRVNLPATNTVASGLNLVSPTTALRMYDQSSFYNSSGLALATSEAVFVSGAGAVDMRDGSYYQHNTLSGDASLLDNLSASANSTIEYDIPAPPTPIFSMGRGITSPITFGNLIFTATSTGLAGYNDYHWNTTFTNTNIVIQGDLTINANAALVSTMLTNTVTLQGDLTNNSTVDPFFTGIRGLNMASPFILGGSALQTIGGSQPVTFLGNLTVNNTSPAGVDADVNLNIGNLLSATNFLFLTDGVVHTGTGVTVLVENPAAGAVTGHATGFAVTSPSYIDGPLRRRTSPAGVYEFPVGTAALYELAAVEFNSSGLQYLEVEFDASAPGTAGLPLSELGVNWVDALNGGFWIFTGTGSVLPGSYNVTLNETGYSNGNQAAYTVIKRPNSASNWVLEGSLVSWFENGTQTLVQAVRSGLTTFSDFGIATSPTSPLPVEQVIFDAFWQQPGVVEARWNSYNEVQLKEYVVEYSFDNQVFTGAAPVAAIGAEGESQRYAQVLPRVGIVPVVYVRLKQVDLNGAVAYSDVVELRAEGEETTFFIFPNPTAGAVELRFKGVPQDGELQYRVVNVQGKVLRSGRQALPGLVADLNSLLTQSAGGVYFLEVVMESGRRQALRIVKQ